MAKYNFDTDGNQLVVTLVPVDGDVNPTQETFLNPSIVNALDKIKLFDSGIYRTAFRFEDIGNIGGETPTDLSNAFDLIKGLIANFSGGEVPPHTFIPLSGTEADHPVDGDINMAFANLKFNDLEGNPFIKMGYNTDTDETGIWYDNGVNPQVRIGINSSSLIISTPSGSYTSFNSDGIGLTDNGNTEFYGIRGGADYSSKYGQFDFVQKCFTGYSELNPTDLSASALNNHFTFNDGVKSFDLPNLATWEGKKITLINMNSLETVSIHSDQDIFINGGTVNDVSLLAGQFLTLYNNTIAAISI